MSGNIVSQLSESVYLSTGSTSIACDTKFVGVGVSSAKYSDVAIVAQNDLTFKTITFSTIGTGGNFTNASATLYTRSVGGVPMPTSLTATVVNAASEYGMSMGNVIVMKGETYSVQVDPVQGSDLSAAITLEYFRN